MTDDLRNEKLVVVENCPTPFAAHALVALLADYDIHAVLAHSTAVNFKTGGFHGFTDGTDQRCPVLVRESQLELARLTIEDARSDAADLDWDDVELGERHDRLPLKSVPDTQPAWLRIVAVVGIIVLGLSFVAMVLVMTLGR